MQEVPNVARLRDDQIVQSYCMVMNATILLHDTLDIPNITLTDLKKVAAMPEDIKTNRNEVA
jgi:hypothetical protein